MKYLETNSSMMEILEKIERAIYLDTSYNVNQLCWDIQDEKDFFAGDDVRLRAESIDILCAIKFEWEKKKKSILFLAYYLQNAERFEDIKNVFFNKESKIIFDWLIRRNIAYALCGDIAKRLYKVPDCVVDINEEQRIENYQNIFYINGFQIYASEFEMYDTWVRKQYLLESICEPVKGDIVLSAGAFYGETSIWFSEQVGDYGKVYAFEADASNAWVAECNFRRNGISNIVLENVCLWSEEKTVYLKSDNNASNVSEDMHGNEVHAITLDKYCEKNYIQKIDYIKMDIEGAEYEALLGAETIIRKNKPKLAICVYHSAEDFIRIPQKIKEYVPEYRLYLSHKREDLNETVVFAVI